MRTLLILAKESGLAAAVRAVLDPEQYRVVAQEEVLGAEPFLRPGTFDACIFDAEHFEIRPIRIIEKLRRQMPDTPLMVFVGTRQWEWEEEAYLMGVANVLMKPVRGRLLNSLLDRLWETERADRVVSPVHAAPDLALLEPPPAQVRTLEVLRDFSAILSHSLSPDALLQDFLLLLRRILGINRAAIFLRKPPTPLSGDFYAPEARRLAAACALGVSKRLLDHFELSLETGIGGFVHRTGRILRNEPESAHVDPQISKEFELLGTRVAIPILDRESFMGVAVLDERLTGDPVSREELGLVFHLLEELGMAIKNSWLHDQLVANHETMEDVLGQLRSGCVVVARDLTVLHANPACRHFFQARDGQKAPLTFSDLPQSLGGKVFEVLNQGTASPAFRYESPDHPGQVLLISVIPFKRKNSSKADAALLMVDDFTQIARSQQLEVETSNLRLLKTMAEGLAHAIGNSLVPLSTHQQLLEQKIDDPEFRGSLAVAMSEGVRRISRLANQLLYLSRDAIGRTETVRLNRLVEEAFLEAQNQFADKRARLDFDDGQPFSFTADRAGLRHAFAEVMLNAMQANPADPRVRVRIYDDTDPDGREWLRVEVEDSGVGFSSDAAEKALDPFFTTRNVGLGLGLTVTRKIVEAHRGSVDIGNLSHPSTVTISLPLPTEAKEILGEGKDEAPAAAAKGGRQSTLPRIKFGVE